MNEFELKLGNTTYVVDSNSISHSKGSTSQNWVIRAKFHDLNLSMSIPAESKVSTDKVLVFISSFHEALKKVQSEKSKDLTFINQLT